jgi:hypothetical protein
MTTRYLAQSELAQYFDRIAKGLGTQHVAIEVASLAIGDQIEADWVGLTNISYDPRNDCLDIGTDTLGHRIPHPQSVQVQEDESGVHAINVQRRDGTQEIIRLSRPLLLPAPAA